jgi:serine/alanine adding enzyme
MARVFLLAGVTEQMKIHLATGEADAQLWEQFVKTDPQCSNYHRWGWKRVIENSFRWPTFYLLAREDTGVLGILPLVWQKSWMFGSFLTSLPFLNSGGVVAESKATKNALVAEAIALARQLRVEYLELRHRMDPELGLPAKTHKVAMVRPIESDAEKMWAALPHKVRTDIRKAINSGLAADFGGEELLDDFYGVFARNMRDLGTPVYGRNFFSAILRTFPSDNYICIVRHQGRPVAASFLMGYRHTLEAGWSSSLYDYISMKPNMFLYWRILCFGGERGYQVFDFGRSSIGSGTHRFKKQWGSQEVPLYWVYWVPDDAHLPEVNKENPRYRLAISLWRRLPVSVTKLIGPIIVKCLP